MFLLLLLAAVLFKFHRLKVAVRNFVFL